MALIIGIIGAIVVYRLYIRISDLEHTVKELQQAQSASLATPRIAPKITSEQPNTFTDHLQPTTATANSTAVATAATAAESELFIPSAPQGPTPSDTFFNWLRQDVFMKLGALLLLIAFGWFVSYAFANNWIGPMGRIALGLLLGTSIMALGVWRIERYINQGAVFLLLGSSTILLTTFAARNMYDFFTPLTALLLMAVAVAFVAYNAAIHKFGTLAVASILLGGVVPLLVAATEPGVTVLGFYLLTLVLGSIWILAYTHNTALLPTAFAVVALYTVPYMSISASSPEADLALIFGVGFGFIFLVSNCVSMVVHERVGINSASHVVVGVGAGVYLAGWIANSVAEEWHVLAYLLWSIIFAAVAFVVYLQAKTPNPFYVHGAVSLGFLTAATAALFSGPALTLAFTIEIAVLVLLAYQITKNYFLAQALSWLFVVPIILSFDSFTSSAWATGMLHADFFILSSLALVMALVSAILRQLQPTSREEDRVDTSILLIVASSLYAVALVWLVAGALFLPQVAIFTALLLYTLVGLGLYFQGLRSDARGYRLAGGALITLVMVRLLFIDVWQMELTGRIITFAVIGVLLISTAFIGKFNQSQDT